MSEQNKAYYLVESGKALEVLDEYKALSEKFNTYRDEVLARFVPEKDRDHDLLVCGGEIAGLYFSEKPDEKLWKKCKGHHGYWIPRKNSKTAKDMHAFITSVAKPTGRWVAKNFLGHELLWRYTVSSAGFYMLQDQFVIEVYEDKQWEPVDGLRLLKTSEFWQLREAAGKDGA